MSPEQRLILRIVIVIASCLIVFFLTGPVRVNDGQTVFLSRSHRWRKTLGKKGWYYVWPFSYQISRHYDKKQRTYKVRLAKNTIVSFVATIDDPIAYEYRTSRYEEIVAYLWNNQKEAMSEDTLKNALKVLGMNVISCVIPAKVTQQ